MRFIRIGLSGLMGLSVTAALLVTMYTLIESGLVGDNERDVRKIADIWQSKREILDQTKQPRPEKTETPVERPPELPDMSLDVEVPAGAVSMAAPQMNGLQIGLGGGFARDADYVPVYVPQPDYPPSALRRGISGYAVVEVIITTTGGVRDPKLLEEYPKNKGFGKYALRAANKLKYKPRVIDGKAEEVPGVLYKFSFQIAR